MTVYTRRFGNTNKSVQHAGLTVVAAIPADGATWILRDMRLWGVPSSSAMSVQISVGASGLPGTRFVLMDSGDAPAGAFLLKFDGRQQIFGGEFLFQEVIGPDSVLMSFVATGYRLVP